LASANLFGAVASMTVDMVQISLFTENQEWTFYPKNSFFKNPNLVNPVMPINTKDLVFF
jgi:hypothetical protein